MADSGWSLGSIYQKHWKKKRKEMRVSIWCPVQILFEIKFKKSRDQKNSGENIWTELSSFRYPVMQAIACGNWLHPSPPSTAIRHKYCRIISCATRHDVSAKMSPGTCCYAHVSSSKLRWAAPCTKIRPLAAATRRKSKFVVYGLRIIFPRSVVTAEHWKIQPLTHLALIDKLYYVCISY